MMNQAFTDNFRETHKALARKVLQHPLAANVNHPSMEHRLALLLRQAEGLTEVSPWNYFSATFYRAGTSCCLDVELKSKYDQRDTDEEGNEWDQSDLRCAVNFPSHGATEPAIVMARLALYQQVALLAAEIEAEFPEVFRMTRSAKSREEQKLAAEKVRIQALAEAVAHEFRKGMRLDNERVLTVDQVKGIPAGIYNVATSELTGRVLVGGFYEMKQFTLTVFGSGGGTINRIA